MVKMVKLDRSANERKAEAHGGADYPTSVAGNSEDHDGPTLHLDHHHLKKMGLDAGKMKHGDPIEFHGKGHVEHASVDSGEGGERHSARIRMTHGGAEHEGSDDDDRGEIRGAIEKAHGASEAKSSERASLRKSAAGAKVAEK